MGRVNNAACNRITIFYEHRVLGDAQFLLVTAPKAKLKWCSRMGKYRPPATALPNLPCSNNCMVNYCSIGGGLGGGVLLQYWHLGDLITACWSLRGE
jgi:hypothetical protein